MFDRSYEKQVERIGRLGAFAPGSYMCRCLACDDIFQGDKRARQCLACTVTALVAHNTELETTLRKHHEWHQQSNLEMKLGEEYFDCASAYCDSTLEEDTTAALGQRVIHVPPSI